MEKNLFVWIDGMTGCSLATTGNAKDAEAVVFTVGEQENKAKCECAFG